MISYHGMEATLPKMRGGCLLYVDWLIIGVVGIAIIAYIVWRDVIAWIDDLAGDIDKGKIRDQRSEIRGRRGDETAGYLWGARRCWVLDNLDFD